MADTLKGVSHVLTTTITHSEVEAGSGETITIIGLQVANIHATNAGVLDVKVDRGADDDAYVVKGISIPVTDTLSVLQGKIVLETGDKIQMVADAASTLEANVSYLLQT